MWFGQVNESPRDIRNIVYTDIMLMDASIGIKMNKKEWGGGSSHVKAYELWKKNGFTFFV